MYNIDFDSEGERLVYKRFKTDKGAKGYTILHSLFISKHIKQISGELDFVILAPGKGIFCLEVKHGKIERSDGIWTFTGRNKIPNSNSKGPFRQVSDSMHSLKKIVLELTRQNQEIQNRLSKLMYGYGVMFTSMDYFDDIGSEGELWQLFTRSGFENDISWYIDNLSRSWQDKYENLKYKWYNPEDSLPTEEDCETIKKILRGDFSYDYTVINRILDEENLIKEFTNDQFEILDFTDENPRCLIQGGAGTGKTIMALELAKRKTNEGLNIGVFCFNNLLGQTFRNSKINMNLAEKKQVFFGTLSSYMLDKTGLDFPKDGLQSNGFFEADLPNKFITQYFDLEDVDKFDYLIIDEAQDLLSPKYLEIFDMILKKGIKDGSWTFFGDFSNQAIFINNPNEILDNLNAKASFVKFPHLKFNCRNAKKIIDLNTLITGCDKQLMKFGMPEGDSPEILFLANHAEIKIKIENIIKELKTQKFPLIKLTILSPKTIESIGIGNSEYITNFIKTGELKFHTIQSFKGLENTFILITGFDELISDMSMRLMYVAISRARLKVYLILTKAVEYQYQALINKNFSKLEM